MRLLLVLILLFPVCRPILAQHGETGRSEAIDEELKRILMLEESQVGTAISRLDSLITNSDMESYPNSLARVYLELGRKQQQAGDMAGCAYSLTRSYEINDSTGNKKGMTSALINLAVMHIIQNNPVTAREYLENALRINANISEEHMLSIYLNLGITHDMQDNPEKAIEYYEKAIVVAQKKQDYVAMASTYHTIGIAYATMENYKQCEVYELKALETEKKKPTPKLRSQILGSMGSFYFDSGENEKGEKCLAEAIDIAKKGNYWDVLQICYLELAEYYETAERPKEALVLLNEYIDLKDSIDQKKTDDLLADKEAKFRLDLQRKALEVTEIKSENRLRWTLGLSLISVLLLLVSFMFYRNFRLKQKANQLLTAEKAYIESERQNLQEENLILQKENLTAKFETLKNQINPHFLFNALNSLYALVETNPQRAQDFIRQFSQLYRKVLEFNDLPVVKLREEIELVNHYLYLQKIRFGENLRVTIEIDANVLNHFIPPFTIQMLLENAVKHNVVSADDPLSVSIRSNPEKNTLIVSNSLSSRKSNETISTGIGLQNIMSRYRILSNQAPEFKIENNQYLAVLPLLTEE